MFIGLDIGGTKIEICALEENGTVHLKQRISTPQNYEAFIQAVTQLIQSTQQQIGEICPVGIGLPGAISPATGLIKNANCTFLNGHDLQADLNRALQQQVSIANDANCFALSEAVDGAGQDGSVVFGAILGTGCGGGVVFHKTIWNGPNAIGGEWGHNPLPSYDEAIDGPARPCYCGRKNCIEQFISGTGFEYSYQQKTGHHLPARDIVLAMRQGDADAQACYQKLVDQMARSFATLINLLDPDVIVLGGGLSNLDELYQDLPQATLKYVFTDSASLRFEKARFGDSSGIRGAAWLGLKD